jgi:hypothetical protein
MEVPLGIGHCTHEFAVAIGNVNLGRGSVCNSARTIARWTRADDYNQLSVGTS